MGIITDRTSIQFRMLNKSKGPAMWSPRAQSDRMKFSEEWRHVIESNKNLFIWQDNVIQLLIKDHRIEGLVTTMGKTFYATLSALLAIGTLWMMGANASVTAQTAKPAFLTNGTKVWMAVSDGPSLARPETRAP